MNAVTVRPAERGGPKEAKRGQERCLCKQPRALHATLVAAEAISAPSTAFPHLPFPNRLSPQHFIPVLFLAVYSRVTRTRHNTDDSSHNTCHKFTVDILTTAHARL